MLSEINEIIKKNMPSEVGNNLKKLLEEGEECKNKLDILERVKKDLSDEVVFLKSTIQEYQKLDERNSKLEEREKDVVQKEINQKVFEAELKATEAEKRASELSGFVGMVFKSPVFRKTINEPVYDTYSAGGLYSQVGGGLKSEEQTID